MNLWRDMSVQAHQRPGTSGEPELRVALLLTAVMMVIEFIAGWMSGSLALLADAGHMLTDTSALALSLFAAWIARRPANLAKTYGYYRTEILAALANGIALGGMVVWIYVSAIQRLHHPLMIRSGPMMVIAFIGLLVNLFSGMLLHRPRAQSLNVEGAWLNVMSDALGSLGVVIAGVLIWWRGWTVADPIASMLIGALVTLNAWKLITRSVNILLEATPAHLELSQVVQAIQAIPGVQAVHDMHLWTITTGMEAMSGHVVVENVSRSPAILSTLNEVLSQRFGILHTTFQLESPQHVCHVGG